jgi:hypothetical protein
MRPFQEDVRLTKVNTLNGTCFLSESDPLLNLCGPAGDKTHFNPIGGGLTQVCRKLTE